MVATISIKRGQRIITVPPLMTMDKLTGKYGFRDLNKNRTEEAFEIPVPSDQGRSTKLASFHEGDHSRLTHTSEPILGLMQTNGFDAYSAHDMGVFDRITQLYHPCKSNGIFHWNPALLHGVLLVSRDIEIRDEAVLNYGLDGVTYSEGRNRFQKMFNVFCARELCSKPKNGARCECSEPL